MRSVSGGWLIFDSYSPVAGLRRSWCKLAIFICRDGLRDFLLVQDGAFGDGKSIKRLFPDRLVFALMVLYALIKRVNIVVHQTFVSATASLLLREHIALYIW